MRFLPTLVIYIPVHIVAGLPVDQHLLWLIPLIFLMFVMAAGAGMLVSALQVYFRDVKNFLPYFLRVWLYASPVLYYADEVPRAPLILRQPARRAADRVERRADLRANPEPGRSAWPPRGRSHLHRRRAVLRLREREFAVRL